MPGMRRLLGPLIVGLALLAPTDQARAQIMSGGVAPGFGAGSTYYAPPGAYGTSYGVASYGTVRTYSVFSSPYGAGYGYGYGPYGFLPGPYGLGMWRPGVTAPGYAYYATYPVYSNPGYVPPTIGAYAPGFGPGPLVPRWP